MSKGFIVALKDEFHGLEEINGYPIVYGGVGKINAAIGTHELIRKGVSEIINIGSCGSVNHPMSSILKIGTVFQDIDCSPICAYGHTAFEDSEPIIPIDLSSTYSCFTTDYFYDHRQQFKYSSHYLEHIQQCSVFDMELFSIAKVCQKHNIPLSAYKWVSDDGDFAKWQENCDMATHKILEIIFP